MWEIGSLDIETFPTDDVSKTNLNIKYKHVLKLNVTGLIQTVWDRFKILISISSNLLDKDNTKDLEAARKRIITLCKGANNKKKIALFR